MPARNAYIPLILFACLSFACMLLLMSSCASHAFEPIDYVDPLIGTGTSTTPSAKRHSEADNEPRGQTFPAVGHPFGMTQWTPQTRHSERKCVSPYYYSDRTLNGFRGSRWMSGSCTQDYGSVTIMPQHGNLRVNPFARKTAFSHDDETARPDYYAALLTRENIRVELTGHERSGFFRFRFDGDAPAHVIVEPNSDEGVGYVGIDPDGQTITGYNPVHRIYQGWDQYAGFNGYFVVEFDRPFEAFGVWQSTDVMDGRLTITGDSASVGAYVTFDTRPGDVVQARVGTSLTSLDAARANLQHEIPNWDFDATRQASREAWNQALSAICTFCDNNSTTADAERLNTQFYTALYHAMLLPRIFSDVDGVYPGFAGDTTRHRAVDFTYYADFSVWDTYRAVHPLLTITDPDRAQDMVQSLVQKADQGGWLPIFPAWNNYTAAMIGDHVSSIITDAYLKGLRGFDAELAYAYMFQNATETPPYDDYVDGKGRRALLPYLESGYMPLEEPITEAFHQEEQVSRTLEYAYDDFNVGLMAMALGKPGDAELFFERALYYRNIIDPETGIARGRYRDGSWYTPFDPSERTYPFITEGSPWQYTWYVPHDVAGLMELMGGRDTFIARLDTLFDHGEYWHGNEPGHQIAYLYAYAGAPWKTQYRVREIMKEEYSDGPGGLSGNDDAGQMSAWYVFSALGMYPVSPGLPYYVIGSPSFEEVRLRMGADRQFVIRAHNVSDENRYILSATLNGEPFHRPWIPHADIAAGGELVFEMGPEPNTEWGARPEDGPPSQSTGLDVLFPLGQ